MSKDSTRTGSINGDGENILYKSRIINYSSPKPEENLEDSEIGPFGDFTESKKYFNTNELIINSLMNRRKQSSFPSDSSLDDELYNTNNDYMEKLKEIRRKLNMLDIEDNSDSDHQASGCKIIELSDDAHEEVEIKRNPSSESNSVYELISQISVNNNDNKKSDQKQSPVHMQDKSVHTSCSNLFNKIDKLIAENPLRLSNISDSESTSSKSTTNSKNIFQRIERLIKDKPHKRSNTSSGNSTSSKSTTSSTNPKMLTKQLRNNIEKIASKIKEQNKSSSIEETDKQKDDYNPPMKKKCLRETPRLSYSKEEALLELPYHIKVGLHEELLKKNVACDTKPSIKDVEEKNEVKDVFETMVPQGIYKSAETQYSARSLEKEAAVSKIQAIDKENPTNEKKYICQENLNTAQGKKKRVSYEEKGSKDNLFLKEKKDNKALVFADIIVHNEPNKSSAISVTSTKSKTKSHSGESEIKDEEIYSHSEGSDFKVQDIYLNLVSSKTITENDNEEYNSPYSVTESTPRSNLSINVTVLNKETDKKKTRILSNRVHPGGDGTQSCITLCQDNTKVGLTVPTRYSHQCVFPAITNYTQVPRYYKPLEPLIRHSGDRKTKSDKSLEALEENIDKNFVTTDQSTREFIENMDESAGNTTEGKLFKASNSPSEPQSQTADELTDDLSDHERKPFKLLCLSCFCPNLIKRN